MPCRGDPPAAGPAGRDDLPGPAVGDAPVLPVGDQLVEAYLVHNDVSKAVAKKRAVDLLDRVGIPSPDKRFYDYPHQFSGGMRQRAMIAMALMCDPQLLIADEPTTALDVTVQAQILDLMKDLQKEFNSAIIIITHDLGVVAQMAQNVVVMYGGRVVESGTGARHLLPARDALHLGSARLDPAGEPRRRPPAQVDPGFSAVADQPAEGLPVPAALRLTSSTSRATPASTRSPSCCRSAPVATGSGATSRPSSASSCSSSRSSRTCDAGTEGRGAIVSTSTSAEPGRPGGAGRGAARGQGPAAALPGHPGHRLPEADRRGQGGRRHRPDHPTPARRSAWSASPAVARPPPAGWSTRLDEPTGGSISFDGTDITHLNRRPDAAVPA